MFVRVQQGKQNVAFSCGEKGKPCMEGCMVVCGCMEVCMVVKTNHAWKYECCIGIRIRNFVVFSKVLGGTVCG